MTQPRRLPIDLDEAVVCANYCVAETLVLHALAHDELGYSSEILQKIQPDQLDDLGALLYQEMRQLLAQGKPVNLEEVGRKLSSVWGSDKDRAAYYWTRLDQILDIDPAPRHLRWAIDYVAALPARASALPSWTDQAAHPGIAYTQQSLCCQSPQSMQLERKDPLSFRLHPSADHAQQVAPFARSASAPPLEVRPHAPAEALWLVVATPAPAIPAAPPARQRNTPSACHGRAPRWS